MDASYRDFQNDEHGGEPPPREEGSWASWCYNQSDQTFLMRLQGRWADPQFDNRADRLISGVYDHHHHSE